MVRHALQPAAGIGAAVTVGINDAFLTPSLDPELEIVNEGLRVSQATAPLVPNGFEVRQVSIRGDTVLIDILAGASSLIPTRCCCCTSTAGAGRSRPTPRPSASSASRH